MSVSSALKMITCRAIQQADVCLMLLQQDSLQLICQSHYAAQEIKRFVEKKKNHTSRLNPLANTRPF